MKKLAIIAFVFCAFVGFSQNDNKQSAEKMKRHLTKSKNSPEERAEMQTKRMTLQLDLTDKQQQQVNEVLINHYKKNQETLTVKKRSIKEMTNQQRRTMKMAMLDSQIELKEKMKGILDEKQYEKYSTFIERYMQKQKGQRSKMKKQ